MQLAAAIEVSKDDEDDLETDDEGDDSSMNDWRQGGAGGGSGGHRGLLGAPSVAVKGPPCERTPLTSAAATALAGANRSYNL